MKSIFVLTIFSLISIIDKNIEEAQDDALLTPATLNEIAEKKREAQLIYEKFGAVIAAHLPTKDREASQTNENISKRNRYPLPKRITLRHIEGPRDLTSSYGTNYSTVEMLIGPEYKLGQFLPMVDLRGHRFDNTKYASNVGFVGRYIPDNFCKIYGANAYWDYRQGSWGGFHQLGVGIEVLGRRWDFRANGYIPLKTTERIKTCVFDDYIGDYVITRRKIEFVSYGYNAEVGYLAVRSDKFLLYGAASLYYLSGRGISTDTRGGKFRIRPQYKDYIAIDLSVSYDNIFRAVYQAEVLFTIPLYHIASHKYEKNRCGLTDRQIYQPVERYEIMPIGKKCCWKTNF
jgi:hypothetical protein